MMRRQGRSFQSSMLKIEQVTIVWFACALLVVDCCNLLVVGGESETEVNAEGRAGDN